MLPTSCQMAGPCHLCSGLREGPAAIRSKAGPRSLCAARMSCGDSSNTTRLVLPQVLVTAALCLPRWQPQTAFSPARPHTYPAAPNACTVLNTSPHSPHSMMFCCTYNKQRTTASEQELAEIRAIERVGHRRRRQWLNDKLLRDLAGPMSTHDMVRASERLITRFVPLASFHILPQQQGSSSHVSAVEGATHLVMRRVVLPPKQQHPRLLSLLSHVHPPASAPRS